MYLVGSPFRCAWERAIFSAVSFASEPPLTGKTRDSVPGVSSASLSHSSMVDGIAVPTG